MFIKSGNIYFCEGKKVMFLKLLLKYVMNKYKYISCKLILQLFRIDKRVYEYPLVNFN